MWFGGLGSVGLFFFVWVLVVGIMIFVFFWFVGFQVQREEVFQSELICGWG